MASKINRCHREEVVLRANFEGVILESTVCEDIYSYINMNPSDINIHNEKGPNYRTSSGYFYWKPVIKVR